ncbi:MAG: hypothetical protein BJ554DRAFT_4493, partial [Olpidium bornovanus]
PPLLRFLRRTGQIEQKDKYKIAQESYQTECRATNIVRQAEGLLSIIADLKQSLLVNDEQQLLHITATRRVECIDQKKVIKTRIARLKDDLDMAIWDLEDVYYSSPYR